MLRSTQLAVVVVLSRLSLVELHQEKKFRLATLSYLARKPTKHPAYCPTTSNDAAKLLSSNKKFCLSKNISILKACVVYSMTTSTNNDAITLSIYIQKIQGKCISPTPKLKFQSIPVSF